MLHGIVNLTMNVLLQNYTVLYMGYCQFDNECFNTELHSLVRGVRYSCIYCFS